MKLIRDWDGEEIKLECKNYSCFHQGQENECWADNIIINKEGVCISFKEDKEDEAQELSDKS